MSTQADSIAPPPSWAPWLGRAIALAALLGAGACLLWPVLPAPTSLVLGRYATESAGHARNMSAALMSLPAHGIWWLPAEVPGLIQANIEPAWTLLAAPFFFLGGRGVAGFCLAWNAVFAVVLLGSWLGSWIFAREWLPRDPWRLGAAGIAALVATSTFFLGSAGEGRLETLTQFLYPLHLAFLYRATVSRRRWRDLVPAALSFGFLAMEGGYPALWLALVEVPVALWCLWLSPQRRRSLSFLVIVAAVGAACLAPYVVVLLRFPPPPFLFRHNDWLVVPLSAMLPWGQAADLFPVWLARPYPGLFLLLLALGAASRDRRSWFWLGAALVSLGLILGPELRWTSLGPVLLRSPLALLKGLSWEWLLASSAYRMGSYVPFFLALAVAPLLARWRPRVAAPLLLLAALDALQYRPAWDQEAWDPRPPAPLKEIMRQGDLLQFPHDDRVVVWGILGEAPISVPPAFVAELPLTAWLGQVLPDGVWARAMPETLPSSDCLLQGADILARSGYEAIGLRFDNQPTLRKAMGDILAVAWGPAFVRSPDLLVWKLPVGRSPGVDANACDPQELLRFDLPVDPSRLPAPGMALPLGPPL